MSLDPSSILALNKLLTEEASDDDDAPISGIHKLGPGSIGEKQSASETSKEPAAGRCSKDIWDPNEVYEGSEFSALYDPRPQPAYEIVFKQAVTTEDLYLQMGNKTPTTASCEDLVVKITLPGTVLSDIELDVKPKFLDCRTPKYYLGLHLPHAVDHRSGKANWDDKIKTLVVTLRMVREFDMFNF